MKNQRGVNLVSLSVAVIVIITIVGTVLYNVRTNLGVQRLKAMQADIENLRGKVANYYLQYGALPILKQQEIDESVLNDNVKTVSNNNIDIGSKYYVIDLSAMENITLTYGEDYEELNVTSSSAENIHTLGNGTLTDVYIINSVSHNIFYVHGIKYEGKTYYTQYQDEEKSKTGSVDINVNGEFENRDGKIIHRIYPGDSAPKDKEAFYRDGEYKAIIPPGFTVSDVKEINETTGEVIKDETSIENGLVVKDGSENEWVWVPVSNEDLEKMYSSGSEQYTLAGTNVKTVYKSLGTVLGEKTIDRGNPGLIAEGIYKEPDVLPTYDTNPDYRKQAGFIERDGITVSSLETMATKLKDDYKDMINSVQKNGGYYIGRYELGNGKNSNEEEDKPQVKAGKVMNYRNWHKLYLACKSFSNKKVESRMIWGCQWDQVCRFISTLGDNKVSSLDDSRVYGNYSNSLRGAEVNSGVTLFNQTTGRNESWKTNNIYDLAGNCWEWTQEANYNNGRARRGRGL